MSLQAPMVFILDDDFRVRQSLTELFISRDIRCIAFKSATEYLQTTRPDSPSCLILDLALPDINGLELQSSMSATDPTPIVFITGHGDIPSSVRAMKAGAVDFLTKPFTNHELLAAVSLALGKDALRRTKDTEVVKLKERYNRLTSREREVLPLIIRGLLNKQAAAELGISSVTLQIHRGRIMHKMKADSIPDLVRMASMLNISSS
jgi:FixJ family two-component response regulator